MSADIKIMTDLELQLLCVRFAANPNTLVDPAVAARLLATAEYYRNAMDVASGYIPRGVLPSRAAS